MTKVKIGLIVKKEFGQSDPPEVISEAIKPTEDSKRRLDDPETHKRFVANLFALVA
ncbi:hypothetical protein KOM00_04100 [Geomonas sp. Red69]|uniref:hypothetical protein n=1 Tax=Geomonas diazotrophica TaxID=2843197 RepID=UPI001C10D202|nr:hypothetical protein [Geomonas diazotrophica]MBU5635908.1 hypothetical protein [Geomonas diazotrophica]